MTAHISLRHLWKISMQLATSVSITETQLVRAAKPRARKNTTPTIRPTPPMAANTRGRLMKVRLGPLGHALGAQEDVHGGDDHHAGQEGHARVEELHPPVGPVQVHVLLHVAAVGDHDAHADAEGEEELAHGVQHHVQKVRSVMPVKSGFR